MTLRHLTLLLAAVVSAALWSCRTSQENMYAAYRTAAEARDAADEDSTIYTQIRRQMKESHLVLGTDTVPVKIQFVLVSFDEPDSKDLLKRYCVVVGQFKMGFNAKSLRDRLHQAGYTDAFVVETREPYYYVVARAFNTAKEAVDFMDDKQLAKAVTMKDDLPFILEPSQLRR